MKMSKVSCELCSLPATTYCESDQAKLCYNCDSKVHKANFLVSKHSRTLLCHLCQNTTPWSASGPMLPPCLSLCVSCATPSSHNATSQAHSSLADHLPRAHHHDDEGCDSYDDDHDGDDDDDDDDDDDGEDEDDVVDDDGYVGHDDVDDEEEEEDNQVVPLTSSFSSPVSSSNNVVVGSLDSSSNEAIDDHHDVHDDDDDDDDDGHDDGGYATSRLPSSLKRKREFYLLS